MKSVTDLVTDEDFAKAALRRLQAESLPYLSADGKYTAGVLDVAARYVAMYLRAREENSQLRDVFSELVEGANRWLQETGAQHVNTVVGRSRTRAAVARSRALLNPEP